MAEARLRISLPHSCWRWPELGVIHNTLFWSSWFIIIPIVAFKSEILIWRCFIEFFGIVYSSHLSSWYWVRLHFVSDNLVYWRLPVIIPKSSTWKVISNMWIHCYPLLVHFKSRVDSIFLGYLWHLASEICYFEAWDIQRLALSNYFSSFLQPFY